MGITNLLPKFFIGPMSKNVVDTIIDFCESTNNVVGLIPSRRQIEYFGGYVNNWKTEEFIQYVKSKTNKVLFVRDHSGPNQGQFEDDGYESLKYDCNLFDVIHIDPWKKYFDYNLGLNETIKMINFCHNINPDILFEVGTEQSIKHFEPNDIEKFILDLKSHLSPKVFTNIKYIVIQSGTSLGKTSQTGDFNSDRLKSMVDIANKYNLLSKEHNGDYIDTKVIHEKFNLGLNSINIAPEFGVIETLTYLNEIKNEKTFLKFYKICYDSKKWEKWVDSNFIPDENKLELIKICGHYVLSNKMFLNEIKNKLTDIDLKIKKNIKNKLNELYGITT